MKITGLEANLLLFALDEYVGVDDAGKVTRRFTLIEGLAPLEVQNLRDRLMALHTHPKGTAL
jgi:hypothetical protein